MELEDIDKMKAEYASLTAGNEQAKAECDNLNACMRNQAVGAATHDGEFSVVVGAMWSLEGRIAEYEDMVTTAEAWARNPLEKFPSFKRL